MIDDLDSIPNYSTYNDLSIPNPGSVLLRRQEHMSVDWQACEATPIRGDQEALSPSRRISSCAVRKRPWASGWTRFAPKPSAWACARMAGSG